VILPVTPKPETRQEVIDACEALATTLRTQTYAGEPLRVHVDTQRELESAIVLFYFGKARQSAEIIKQQQANMTAGAPRAIDALHEMKRDAFEIKDAMLCGDLNAFADVLNRGWEAKKRTASAVSSPRIEELIAGAKDNGAVAAKISGAGGGGFLLLVADPMRRTQLLRYLDGQNGLILPCRFTQEGSHSWRA
jgi:D-glycero-alpha-D-manno-heptose-7-phosphate kinase